MRLLITGSGGFVGRHLAVECADHGHNVTGMDLPSDSPENKPDIECDLTDPGAVDSAIAQARPEACIHLGGIAFVPVGWSNPGLMFNVNVLGTINILEAFRKHAPAARILVISSSEVYGTSRAGEKLNEDALLSPANPYAVSKAACDLETLLYAGKHKMHTMTARPSNHIGPGQSQDFVVPSFAAQLLEIARTGGDTMSVGNLESARDFTDVRDVVRAYRLLIEKGKPGLAYNIASGVETGIGSILDMLCDITGVRPRIVVDPDKYRPARKSPMIDATRIYKHVKWKPELSIRRTIEDVVSAITA